MPCARNKDPDNLSTSEIVLDYVKSMKELCASNEADAEGFYTFGDPNHFAIQARLEHDDDDCQPLDSVGSWGSWRVIVKNRNFSELILPAGFNGIEQPQHLQHSTWYLAQVAESIIMHLDYVASYSINNDYTGHDLYKAFGKSNCRRMAHSMQEWISGCYSPYIRFRRNMTEVNSHVSRIVTVLVDKRGTDSLPDLSEEVHVSAIRLSLLEFVDWLLAQEPLRKYQWCEELRTKFMLSGYDNELKEGPYLRRQVACLHLQQDLRAALDSQSS